MSQIPVGLVWEYGRYVSICLNLIIFFFWLRRKVVLSEFLEGHWVGSLHAENDGVHTISCNLFCINHPGRDNSALLCYERKILACGTVTARGVDRLDAYTDRNWFFTDNCWNPAFVRLMHNHSGDIAPAVQRTQLPVRYSWQCKIIDRYFKQKLSITIGSGSCVFNGVFTKE